MYSAANAAASPDWIEPKYPDDENSRSALSAPMPARGVFLDESSETNGLLVEAEAGKAHIEADGNRRQQG